MPRKFVCTLTKEQLEKEYIENHKTIDEMCKVIGAKSTITVSKVLQSYGIDTNNNQRIAQKSKHGMSDNEFKAFLEREYNSGKSADTIGRFLGISGSAVRKYMKKYNIDRRSNTEHWEKPENNSHWIGGRRVNSNGYIEIYCPEHPNANTRKTVYEHQLVMEKHIGRYLRKNEVVHHCDGNKQNNNIENLMLLTNSDHIKLHAILNRSKKLMSS